MGKLIRLELFNFKSYKGHHTLLFGDSYFTSIIGPNGSGKSNSMDAISFVLGIKSSHLRSAHLKDLVYRGRVLKTAIINDDGSANNNGQIDNTTDKASKGDPKTAWVMAVYVDDADDVHKWKRSITNQGVSEYRINDRVVTAQQYNAALEAENILIKARNFLVFQGDVEAIASQSPQDLTHLIEQISGSLDYKPEYEKLQSLSEQAAENLTFQLHRRRGINSEIKQYREQKREAQNFQKKVKDRNGAIVVHTLWKLFHFEKVMDEATESINAHQEDLKDLRRYVESFEQRLEEARRDQQIANRQFVQIGRDIKAKEKSLEDDENTIIPFDEKIKETERQIGVLQGQTSRVGSERDERMETVKKVSASLKQVEKAEEVFETQTQQQLKKQGRAISAADRKDYDALQTKVESRTATNQSELQHLERTRRADEVTVNNLKGKIDRLTGAIEHHQAGLSDVVEQKNSAQVIIADLTKKIATGKKEFAHRQSDRIQSNQKRTDLEEKLQDVLGKLREADDGRRQSAKEAKIKEAVASLKNIFSGVRGRVGELCKPKQKKFEEAVIVALGADFDSVVVDTEKTASDCIAYLKEQRIPSMRFIPLDNIKVHAVNTAVKGINGVRLTIDTINFEASVERAISYACGNSVVCDSMVIARHVCYERKISVEAVTLDGFVIHESGTMTGGRGPETSKSKRKFEDGDVHNLQRMVTKLKDEMDNLPRAGRAGEEEEALQTGLIELERRLIVLQDELQAFKRNEASKKRELDGLKKELRELRPKHEEKAGALKSTDDNVQEYRDAISGVEDQVFSDFCTKLGYADIRAYRASQGQFDQDVQQQRNEFSTQKQQLRSRLDWEQDRLTATQQRCDKNATSIKKLQREVKRYAAEKEEVVEQLRQDQAEVEILIERSEEYKVELAERSETVASARAELQKRSKGIESRQKEIDRLETAVKTKSAGKSALLRRSRLEQVQVPLSKGSLDNLPDEDDLLNQDPDAMELDGEDEAMMNIALDDHGIAIDYTELEDEHKESDDAEIELVLTERIAGITAELEKLNPNMRAIERLDVVEARLLQIDAEYVAAKNAAHAMNNDFKQVKNHRYEKFNEAFIHIQKEISTVYKNLTRSEAYPLGGQAYLDIEEDTDMPYLSGIKYHAMPPLKRFRDMEHLSGGEKTMAALALLFAIHSWRASPFFVLDEVDAALDNANVDKIKKYIRDHAAPGMQFIVISLKAGLFQDSESLVGIYRDQEVNSSRAMTLDLRKYA